MESVAINILNGITFGMILFLIASGLSIIYGFMGVLNLAHGALYVLGAYVGFAAVNYSFPFGIAIFISGIVIGLVGLLLERIFLKHLHKQINEQVLLTLGFVYVISNLVKWIWGSNAILVESPAILSGSINIGNANFPVYRLIVIAIGLALAAILWLLTEKTRIGSIIRAGIDNKEMTAALGVNYELVSSVVFVMGAFVGGAAGFVGLPIIAVYPGIIFDVLLWALIVIVVGGVSRIEGVLLGSLVIGLIDSLGRAYFPDFAYFTMYLAMIIILLVKPKGLLTRGR